MFSIGYESRFRLDSAPGCNGTASASSGWNRPLMPDDTPKGRPRRLYPEFLCERLEVLQRIFAWAIPKPDWERMHRPMSTPYDPNEEAERRREYSTLLERLACSDLVGRCDPNDDSGYPAGILRWQYAEGLLAARRGKGDKRSLGMLSARDANSIVERQCEYARRLALLIVAEDAKASPEYLQKLCREFARLTQDHIRPITASVGPLL